MKTAKERESAFRREFVSLLAKHNATFVIATEYEEGEPNKNKIPVVIIYMPSEWDNTGNKIKESTEFKM